MPDWTVLKLEMAVCWKVSWNVDPLPLSVPVRLAALLDDELLLPDDGLLLPEDPQAATKETIAAVASPTVIARWMRRCCISDTPFPGIPRSIPRGARSIQPPTASWSACQL